MKKIAKTTKRPVIARVRGNAVKTGVRAGDDRQKMIIDDRQKSPID